PFQHDCRGNPGIPIPREVDEKVMAIDLIKIDRLCSTRSVAGESQPTLPGKGVDQAGLPYVTSPQKSYFRQPGGWERGRSGGADYEFRCQKTVWAASGRR